MYRKTVEEINREIFELNLRYPNQTELELLGYSYEKAPIYVLRILCSKIRSYNSNKRKQEGITNYLILGGVHGREVVNPQLLLYQIKHYLENPIEASVVLHYIPLINPDGYTISLREWKANGRGVDLNRNFPSIYYSIEERCWIDYWKKNDKKETIALVPNGSNYFGDAPGSEEETRIVMDYMNRHVYAMLVDYHSQGDEIYWGLWSMGEAYERYNKEIAKVVSKETGYTLYTDPIELQGSGYTTDYFALLHHTPSITIETTTSPDLPNVSEDMEILAYKRNKDVLRVLINYNETHLKEYQRDFITLYNQEGDEFGRYPKEKVLGYKQRYNLKEETI